MTDRATFNIGNQQAGTINVAGRDQILGESLGTLNIGLRSAVSELRAALAATPLKPRDRQRAEDLFSEIENEAQSEQPDRARIATRLQSLVDVLFAAGGMARHGQELIDPLRNLAGWLGHAGATLLRLLG